MPYVINGSHPLLRDGVRIDNQTLMVESGVLSAHVEPAYVRTSANNAGTADATSQLQADLSTAMAASYKRLYLPAGTYDYRATSGRLFDNLSNVEIFGDGRAKTIIRLPANTVLTGNLYFFRATGNNVWLHDFSIQVGAGASGAFNMFGVSVTAGAFRPRLERIEVSGIYGNGTAGGSCFDFYQPYDQAEVSTTLGTTIAAGTRTVTPESMAGIYVGRTLVIGGATETIQVSSVTELTFTATFANAHNASDTVTGTSNGCQYAYCEDLYAHDSYKACGFIINSGANTFVRCRGLRLGSNSTQHGVYVQALQNTFIDCRMEGVSGFSYHQHIATNVTDASGNRYIGCESINPGTQHFIADSSASNGTNYDVPNGEQLARYTQVIGCLFRRTRNAHACEGVQIIYGGIIQSCAFEDATGGGSAWIYGGTNNIVQGNVLCILNTGNAGLGIIGSGNSAITGNQLINWSGATGIRVDGACTLQANAIDIKGASAGIMINASSANVLNNLINVASNSAALGILINNPSLTNLNVKNNEIVCVAPAVLAIDFQAASFMPTLSVFANNRWSGNSCYCRYYDASLTLQWINNRGDFGFRGNATRLSLDEASGRLHSVAKGTNTHTAGLLVKFSGATLGTSDTVFYGVAVSTTDNTNNNALLVGEGECPIQCDDAWAAGNIGVPSTTSAGKIHDSASGTPPASGSYILFLDSGGAAGTARCLLIKTV